MSLLHVNAQLTAIAGPSGERYDSDGAGTSRLPQPIDAYSTVIRSLAGGDTGGAVAENVLIVATADVSALALSTGDAIQWEPLEGGTLEGRIARIETADLADADLDDVRTTRIVLEQQ